MLKCFIVQNIDDNTPTGVFNKGEFYIAKISNNDANTFAVLDENENWVPFNRYSIENSNLLYSDYFNEKYEHYFRNKKELNDYIDITQLYK